MGTLPQEVTQPLTAKRKYPEKRKKRGKTRLLTLKHTQKAKDNKLHLGNSTKRPHGASQGGQQQGDAVKQPEQLAQGWLFFWGGSLDPQELLAPGIPVSSRSCCLSPSAELWAPGAEVSGHGAAAAGHTADREMSFLSHLSLKAAFISLSPFCRNVSVSSFNKYHLRCS